MFETHLKLHDCHNPSFVLFLSLTKIAILRWYRPPLEFSPKNWLGSTYSHLEFFSSIDKRLCWRLFRRVRE
ncbi:hypothetical protein RchiOBHm_Chr2g0175831 [Rosa chinensis]|uniref:Uncharacterized protein n=1 Tax=Rosa chinensis TaxID=74649 RepID=A0A2P6S6I0_ROSCH|nr:hypothetical protein RchiOBHm_Chr2g0175831 [Rosa chinensis]